MKRKQTIELLKKIYENSRTGMETAEMLMGKSNSEEFERLLKKSRESYYEIAAEADIYLSHYRELPPENKLANRFNTWTALHMSAAKSPGKIAELYINGCTEGIIEITKLKNNASYAENDALDLAEKLTKAERSNIARMEDFL